MRIARLSRRTRILAVAVALAVVADSVLFLMPAKSDAAETHTKLWMTAVDFAHYAGPSPNGPPHLDRNGVWRTRNGQAARLRDSTDRAGPENIDGPPYLVMVSLGQDGSYGNFLRTLKALARDRACIVAIADSDDTPIDKRLRTSPALEIEPAAKYAGCSPPMIARSS